jgi:hypothetical protein
MTPREHMLNVASMRRASQPGICQCIGVAAFVPGCAIGEKIAVRED